MRTIPAAIDASEYFILLLSPKSIASEWVEREYLRALNRHMKIIPVMIEQCEAPFALANINYIDFTAHSPEVNLQKLLAALETGIIPEPKKDKPKLPSFLAWKTPIWIGIAAILGIFLLVGILRSCAAPLVTPTPTTAIQISPLLTATLTSTPTPTAIDTHTVTPSPSTTASPTPDFTDTPTLTLSPTPTKETSVRIELCIKPEIGSMWVRIGPGKNYEAFPKGLKGEDCLLFSARNEDNTWYMIAPRQPDAQFRDFELGWVLKDLLTPEGPIALPVATPIPTATRTPLPTITPTFTPTVTLTWTLTFTPTETNTPIPTDTRMPTATTDLEPTTTP